MSDIKQGDHVEVFGVGWSVKGWLWRRFRDYEGSGQWTYAVLPYEEAGTQNVWEGTGARRLSGGPPVGDAFAALRGGAP